MPIALGLVLGSILFVDVLNQDLVTGYVTLAVLMVPLVLPFVLYTPGHPLAPEHREPFSWRQMASSYWISPVRGDRGGGHRRLARGLADQERPLTVSPQLTMGCHDPGMGVMTQLTAGM